MALSEPDLSFGVEWAPADGVSTPELRETWARLTIRVRDEVITQVEDSGSGSVRNAVYVPIYPLAEWIAFNWWHLRVDHRPSYLPSYTWTYRARHKFASSRTAWLSHHNLRGVGEGQAWPDLTLLPTSIGARLFWRRDRTFTPSSRVRFINSGQALVPQPTYEASLVGVVEETLARLAERGVVGTTLESEWAALRAMGSDEAEFCAAAARMGLDPFDLPASVSDLILRAGDELAGDLLPDFLDAADPDHVRDDLAWVLASSQALSSSHAVAEAMPSIDHAQLSPASAWQAGLADARQFRGRLALASEDQVDPSRWMPVERVEPVERSLLGLGGVSRTRSPILALPPNRSPEADRFASARAIWRASRTNGGDGRFLLTSARSPVQQAERAFAAEFLAPTGGLSRLITPGDGVVDPDEVAAASKHFGVNEWVIEYQLVNQLGRDIDDPSLETTDHS